MSISGSDSSLYTVSSLHGCCGFSPFVEFETVLLEVLVKSNQRRKKKRKTKTKLQRNVCVFLLPYICLIFLVLWIVFAAAETQRRVGGWRSGRESASGCFLNCTIVMRLWFRGCEWPETAHSGSLTGREGGFGVPLRGCSASELLPLSRLAAAGAVREKPRGECKQT